MAVGFAKKGHDGRTDSRKRDLDSNEDGKHGQGESNAASFPSPQPLVVGQCAQSFCDTLGVDPKNREQRENILGSSCSITAETKIGSAADWVDSPLFVRVW